MSLATPFKIDILPQDKIKLRFTCPSCGQESAVTVDQDKYNACVEGQNVQNAFPELSDAEREVMMTGFHDECFDAIFADDEDEDDGMMFGNPDYDLDDEPPNIDQMGLS